MPGEPIPIAVFARAPSPGRTKTRLAAAIGAERAAELAAAFLSDTLRCVAQVPAVAPALWAASDGDAAILRARHFSVHVPAHVPVHVQPDGDLGDRMHAAIAHGLASHDRAIVIGSDAPTLPPRLLERALSALSTADVVIGPSADGGYYLLGTRTPLPPLLGVRWSTSSALADTRALLRDRAVALLPPWYDVDTADDLALLRCHLALRPHAAPATAAALDFFR